MNKQAIFLICVINLIFSVSGSNNRRRKYPEMNGMYLLPTNTQTQSEHNTDEYVQSPEEHEMNWDPEAQTIIDVERRPWWILSRLRIILTKKTNNKDELTQSMC